MKKKISILFIINSLFIGCFAFQINDYKSLDKKHPITFLNDRIIYDGDTICLGPHTFFIDGRLSDKQCSNNHFVFNSINTAVGNLTEGNSSDPMVLLIAPYVYWIDNPDTPNVVFPEENQITPYGLEIKCNWLTFKGLSPDAENVILACNRGQTIGAKGNFTMFKIIGDGISSENITFGNYCNVDLVYSLLPELSRKKRAEAIVQAQLIHCDGDKIFARNTRFISRLNLCPFVGGKRILFDSCYFESTDDALPGTAVFFNSTLKFFSSKPFYHTTGTGATFINCDIFSYTSGRQFFTKANGQIGVIDTRMYSKDLYYIGWNDLPPLTTKNYLYNFTLNDTLYKIGYKDPTTTVNLSGKSLLDAYRIDLDGTVIYNIYNLLKGDDNWDPLKIKSTIIDAEEKLQVSLTDLPVKLLIKADKEEIETNKSFAQLSATMFRFGNYLATSQRYLWELSEKGKHLVELIPGSDGKTCKVIAKNFTDSVRTVLITAKSKSGLEGTCLLKVYPEILEAPYFKQLPSLEIDSGVLRLNYILDTDFEDDSKISWFRSNGKINTIEVAVTRNFLPLRDYTLSKEDIGYIITAKILPKHVRSGFGDTVRCSYKKTIVNTDILIRRDSIKENFKNISTQNADHELSGFWIMRHFNDSIRRLCGDKNAWCYGSGRDGAYGKSGLIPTGRQASLYYTPTNKKLKNMSAILHIAPYKTAGQAFSIAGLYADFLIKYDFRTKTGYGLRFIRTTRYYNATECYFVSYDNGRVTGISDTLTTSCYRPDITIKLCTTGNILKAQAWSDHPVEHDDKDVLPEIKLETIIKFNQYNGFGLEFNGGVAMLIKDIELEWH